jgi:hypothetical protein
MHSSVTQRSRIIGALPHWVSQAAVHSSGVEGPTGQLGRRGGVGAGVSGRGSTSTAKFFSNDIDADLLTHPFWDADLSTPYVNMMDQLMDLAEFGGDNLTHIPEGDARLLFEEYIRPPKK